MVVVIDPGHGGSAMVGGSSWNNAVGPGGTLEKTLTLDIGLRVADLLRGAGHTTRMTRDGDTNLGLKDRADVARKARAGVFVSIHFNGSTAHNAQGTETIVHTNHSASSARLSLAVQDALLPRTGLKDRNKTRGNAKRIIAEGLGVLNPAYHDATTAACLVEVSFLDRADEEDRLRAVGYRADIAQGITEGILAFLGVQVPASALAEHEDAISAAATGTDITTFLGQHQVPAAAGAVGVDAEAGEAISVPANAFAKAFISGIPTAALLPNDALFPDPTYLGEFVAFIDGLGLQHFAPDEFLELGASNAKGACKGLNTLPPRALWPRIAPTAVMLDRIRAALGAPVRILSCYRAADYNACIKGEPNSLHTAFNAIDFTCAAGTPEIWRRVAGDIRSSEPRFTGGIGVYPTRGFLHIDTRGTLANWSGA